MEPSPDTRVYETSTSHYWFENGVFYLVSKENKNRNTALIQKEAQELKQKIGEEPVCAIMDISRSTPTSSEERKRSAEQLPLYFKAIAFIISNPVTRMLSHLYLGSAGIKIPVKMFSKEEEALEWLQQYLPQSPHK